MQTVMQNWNPDYLVSLLQDYVLPVIVGGVFLVGIFWLVGYVVNALLRIIGDR